jgi:hypothetical protein
LQRLQHGEFGHELRAHIQGTTSEEREVAGIVIGELNELLRCKASGSPHPAEQQLNGPVLSEIRYLKLYKGGHSIRVYFTTIRGNLWLLALDANKRRQNVDAGTETMLKRRLKEAKGDADHHAKAASKKD